MRTTPDILHSMRSAAEAVAWPSFMAGQAAVLAALVNYMEASQWLAREEVERCQFQQLVHVATYAFVHSPYFRQRMEKAGLTPADLGTAEGLAKLPVLTRREMKLAGESMYCTTVPPTHLPQGSAKTSGSTGEPINVKKTAINGLFWQANMMRDHFWNKRDITERLLVIRSGDVTVVAEQDGWGHPVSILYPSGRVRVVPVSTDLKDQVQHLQQFAPQHLLVYPNNLDAIISQCEKDGVRILGLKHIWCFAETLSPRVKARAEAFFGARVEDNYSSQELGIIALPCPDGELYHVCSESLILEVLDEEGNPCKEGQSGRVVVTDLQNFATPVIRYALGDYAQMGGKCSCGRGLHTLNAIHGRERNLIVKPDGTRHWPRLNFDECEAADDVLQYQIVQLTLEEIEIRLVAEPKLTPEQEKILFAHMQESLNYPFSMHIAYYEGSLPRSANGKFEEFISYCKQD